jgi:hypothetical protein
MALDIPDGPGALNGLIFLRVSFILLVEKVGNLDHWVFGGSCSANWWSVLLLVCSGGKNVLASIFALPEFVVVMVLFGLLMLGILCQP